MGIQAFALTLGIIYAGIGILGFIPAFLTPPAGAGAGAGVTPFYGFLLGLFAVNVIHSIVHLAVGVWGIAAGTQLRASVTYTRTAAVLFGVLAIMGLIPGLNTFFGLIPLYGNDIWLHGITAAMAAYFGWRGAPAYRERRNGASDRRRRALAVARERRIAVADRRSAGIPRGA